MIELFKNNITKKITKLFFILNFFIVSPLLACPLCETSTGKEVRRTLFNHDFIFVFLSIFSVFITFFLIVIIIAYLSRFKILNSSIHKNNLGSSSNKELFFIAGVALGGSIAGFLDGIIFHQVLQMHAMISNKLPMNSVVNIETNMFWDGIFHAFTLITLIIGLLLLVKAFNSKKNRPSNIYILGTMILGAGIFNMLEGLIDHEILQLHHVAQFVSFTIQFYTDIIFLFLSLVLIIIGAIISKKFS